MELILFTKPQSVLDIGIGFGKYGFLCREYLELWDGRNQYNDWQRRIDGIEVFPNYITPLQKIIYNNIFIGNSLEVLPEIDFIYDLIILVDVIEHFDIDEGKQLLYECSRKSKAIIIATPIIASPQGDAFGNPYERHKSQWTKNHFESFENKVFIPDNASLLCYIRFDQVQTTEAPKPAFAMNT